MQISRKQYKETFLPKVGDKVAVGEDVNGTIIYVHDTKLRLTADGKAIQDKTFEVNNMVWQVDIVDDKHNRWNASFVGIKSKVDNTPLPVLPETNEEEVAKVL